MRRILIGVAAMFVTLPAWGQGTLKHDQVFHRTVKAGTELRVFTYVNFHGDCRPGPLPRIALRASPAHGTLSFRQEPNTVRSVREGRPDCRGKTYDGLGIYYTPAAGYTGKDSFAWDMIETETPSHDSAVVEVQ